MKSLDQLYDRCKLNLELITQLQLDTMAMRVDEDDLKSFIYYLGELKAIKENKPELEMTKIGRMFDIAIAMEQAFEKGEAE